MAPVQITIIGLGQIGASIGLALAGQKERLIRVGNDIDLGIARKAEKLGAVDKTMINLPSSVKEAGIVVLALPLDQIKETLGYIAEDLKPGAVVMDTAPVKGVVSEWIKEILPEERYYVGLTPVINPAHLDRTERGIDAAAADLFQKGLFALVTTPQSNSAAIDLAIDLVSLLGAEHMFTDAAEIDGLMAATHTLPQLLSAALVDITIDRPGWQEGKKVAGRAYSGLTGSRVAIEEPAALSQQVLQNRTNLLRVIDTMIMGLQDFKEQIETGKPEDLAKRLEKIRQNQTLWLAERTTANWGANELSPSAKSPSSGEMFGRLFGIRPASERKNKTGQKK